MKTLVGLVLSVAVLATVAEPALAAKPKLSVADVSVSEAAGSASVAISLSKKAKRKVTFGYSTEDGSATAGLDYAAASGRVRIRPRKRSAAIEVPLSDDQLDEVDESFAFELGAAKRARIGDGGAKVTIEDDDARPKVSIGTSSVAEGSSGNPLHQLAVSLSSPSGKPVAVDYATAGSTATAGADFVPASGRLSIPAGQLGAVIPLTTIGDSTDEFDEVLTIGLTNASEVDPAEPVHAVTINDDDAAPTVSLSTTSVAEGTEGTFIRSVDVQLSAASAKNVQIHYATASGTATAPADYTAASGDLAFAPGQATQSFDLTVVGDYDDENPDETLTIGFSNPVNVTLPASTQTLTILDDDPPCVSASSPPGTALGPVNGDTVAGSGPLQQSDEISPCGNTDWFNFTLKENNSGSQVDLHGRVLLSMTPNGSPSAGDLDLCVQKDGVPASETCSTLSGSATERVDICIDDPFAPGDQSAAFLVEVKGFGNAVNDYDLQIDGNTTIGTGQVLHLGC